jgi:hypothetical protein
MNNLVLGSHSHRQWDVHSGCNQPSAVLSAEHPPAWEQITLQLISRVK